MGRFTRLSVRTVPANPPLSRCCAAPIWLMKARCAFEERLTDLGLRSMRSMQGFALCTRSLTSSPTFQLRKTCCLRGFPDDLECCLIAGHLNIALQNSLRGLASILILEQGLNA